MRGKRLRKLPCVATLLTILLVINLLTGGFAAKANDQETARILQPVLVKNGDTLWGLVDEYYQYDGDIRKAIYEVKQINALKGGNIMSGQVIYIPRD